jgi:hypothetical protein
MGSQRYSNARSLLITADCGGSNGARVRLWKRELQGLADELGLTITVCHLPPGTSKWPPRCLVWVATASRGADLVFLGSAESRFSAPA